MISEKKNLFGLTVCLDANPKKKKKKKKKKKNHGNGKRKRKYQCGCLWDGTKKNFPKARVVRRIFPYFDGKVFLWDAAVQQSGIGLICPLEQMPNDYNAIIYTRSTFYPPFDGTDLYTPKRAFDARVMFQRVRIHEERIEVPTLLYRPPVDIETSL